MSTGLYNFGRPEQREPKRIYDRGPEVMFMYLGQTLRLAHGIELELVYVEDNIPIFRGKPKGKRHEAWTTCDVRRDRYYRVCRWPSRKKPVNFDKLINKANSVQEIMRQAFNALARYSFQGGHA